MELTSSFDTFLTNVRLTTNQTDNCITGHKTLRDRLRSDATLAPYIINTFLQGSYRRATAVRPKGESRADVDVIVVTNLHENDYTPKDAIELFQPFLAKHYTGADGKPKYRVQGRSIGIGLSYVDLDLVITSAPSESQEGLLISKSLSEADTAEFPGDWPLVKAIVEAEESYATYTTFGATKSLLERSIKATATGWKVEALRIPDHEAQVWKDTHPLAQIQWTWEKSKLCNGYYVNVVQAIKWWRRLNDTPKYPKGYPVEHLIGQHCPDAIESVAEGVVKTLESIANSYSFELSQGVAPVLCDHGVADHNVFARVSGSDFKVFHGMICAAAKLARRAYDEEDAIKSSEIWRELFGDKFPQTAKSTSSARVVAAVTPANGGSVSGPRPLKDNPYA